MEKKISRRSALAGGIAGTGLIAQGNFAFAASYSSKKGPGREKAWGPGPDPDLKKDLKPGKTPVRLAGYLSKKDNSNPGEEIAKLASRGLHACIASADNWHDATDSEVRELKAAMKQHDVIIFEVGGYRNLLHTDEKVRSEYINRIAYCLEAAEKVGCPMVGTISGSRNPEGNKFVDNYAVHPDNWTLETWELLQESLHKILDLTKGLKAAIGMEAQITTNIDSPLAHLRLIEDMKSDRIKVNLDPTNMVHLYNHFHTTELINECFDTLGEHIAGCHAKDSYVLPHSQTVHVQEVCPGRGRLDYETYFVRLSRMKWARALLPEHIPSDQFEEAYEYLRTVANRVGVKLYG